MKYLSSGALVRDQQVMAMVARHGQYRIGFARAAGHCYDLTHLFDVRYVQAHAGSGQHRLAIAVKVIAKRFGDRAAAFQQFELFGLHSAVAGHVVGAPYAIHEHVGVAEHVHDLAYLRELDYLALSGGSKRIGQMHQPVMSAQPAGYFSGQRAGLCFYGAAQSAARGQYLQIDRRAGGYVCLLYTSDAADD